MAKAQTSEKDFLSDLADLARELRNDLLIR